MAITFSSGVDISALFSTGSSSKSNTDAYSSIMNLDLADVASVRNGSYGKLMKNYYKQSKAEAKSAVGDTDGTLSKIKSGADKLGKAAEALQSKSLWESDADGKLKNADDAVKAVKEFASAYNSVINSAKDSETKSVLRNAGWMDTMTQKNSALLDSVGISVASDGTLSVDEEKLKSANASSLKGLFSGAGSYADSVSTKATSIGNAAANTEGIYTGKASWSSELNSIAKSSINKVVGSEDEESTTAKSSTSSASSTSQTEIEDKLKGLNERLDALKKSQETAKDYATFKDYDEQIRQVNKEIEETQKLLGGN